MKYSVYAICSCGSGRKYKKCCQVYHKGAIAEDVLTLMKSRYSAFAMGETDYIIDTSTFQADYDDFKAFSDGCEFDLSNFDVAVAMDERNKQELLSMAIKSVVKILDFGFDGKDVADLYYEPHKRDELWQMVSKGVDAALEQNRRRR